MADPYNPDSDYAAAYDSLSKRIASNFAGQRAGLNQELATRGVQTSGVSSIPSAALRTGEAGAMDDAASQFALEQARTKVSDRQAAEEFARNKELAQIGWDQQSAIARRQASAGLTSALISGGLGVAGAFAGGPAGAVIGSQLGSKLIAPKVVGSASGGYNGGGGSRAER